MEVPLKFAWASLVYLLIGSTMGVCPDGILDVYHMKNCNEGINSYLKAS